MVDQLNAISLDNKTKLKTSSSDDGLAKKVTGNKTKIRDSEPVSPTYFLWMQRDRSSALAHKRNTTLKLTHDCQNLFADLMLNVDKDGKVDSNNDSKDQDKKTSFDKVSIDFLSVRPLFHEEKLYSLCLRKRPSLIRKTRK